MIILNITIHFILFDAQKLNISCCELWSAAHHFDSSGHWVFMIATMLFRLSNRKSEKANHMQTPQLAFALMKQPIMRPLIRKTMFVLYYWLQYTYFCFANSMQPWLNLRFCNRNEKEKPIIINGVLRFSACHFN